MSLLQVKTRYGLVEGVAEEGYTVFKGIPFAQAPVGALRFCPPREPEPFEGVFKADTFGKKCPQQAHVPTSFYGKEFYCCEGYTRESGEDCLHLNVWTPAEDASEKLPVAVWIHGGAFFNGYNSEISFDGAGFARRGVILVTINYRMGAWGFLAHPWLEEEGYENCGNQGLLDQIAALKYVKDNIAAFGGDPEKVTIFGQSAGAQSVLDLVVSPLSAGLFRYAILQSSGGLSGGRFLDSKEEALEKGKKFVEFTGAKNLEELRAIPWEEMQKKANIFFDECRKSGRAFSPTVDGYVLPEEPQQMVLEGKRHPVVCMLGATENDFSFNGKVLDGCTRWAETDEKNGMPADYLYFFRRKLPGDDAGAFHSSELWFIFQTLSRAWRPFTEADYALAEKVADGWCNFVKYGNPGWDPYTKENPCVKEWNIEE